MSRYGYFDTFCRDSGSRWSTLPGEHCASVCAVAPLNAHVANMSQYATYVALSLSLPPRWRFPSLILARQLFSQAPTQGGDGWGNCNLQGITLSNGKVLANLGQYCSMSTWTLADWNRVHTAMRHSNSYNSVPALEVREEESGRWKEVRI